LAVFGGYDEQALGAAVAAAGGPRCLDLCGRLSLPGMIEAMRLMDLLVTNDTGPMHVAVALGRPVVALFGPTDAARTGPYRRPGEVLVASDAPACAPCFRDRCAYPDPMACLKRIGVAAVADQVARRLG
jgi:ADP-heptose:LPS heptosyltransferase